MKTILHTALILASFFSQIHAEEIDNMWCVKSDGFSEWMKNQGYSRELTLPFSWGEFDSSVSHNISGSSVNTYEMKSKNQWALYTKEDGSWKIFQAIERTNKNSKEVESFVCEVKSGSKFQRH